MSTSDGENKDLLSALDQLLSKYFDEKEEFRGEKTTLDKFWGTYLRAMKDEDEARPKDWDGNTGSILTFVRVTVMFSVFHLTSFVADRSLRCNRRGVCYRKLQVALA